MRDVNFTGFWEGAVVYQCDNCNNHYSFGFSDEEEAKKYKEQRDYLSKGRGWIFTKVNGFWHDFCCEECRNSFIKKNTL